LLNKHIVRIVPEGLITLKIVETEAYRAKDDKACHAFKEKKTERTKYFWEDGGTVYLFSIYGKNICLNIVSSIKDDPEAVLIRACEVVKGAEIV